jgi:hypothetical protein
MIANRLQAVVAGTMGYHSGMTEPERQKLMGQAGKFINSVRKGEVESDLAAMIEAHTAGIDQLQFQVKQLESAMVQVAKQLPIAVWVERKEQRGFGLLFAAIVLGETGDLANYANPAKVWRRLGCAPFTKDGVTHMGSTWRSNKKKPSLSKEDWTEFGYSPRRRSIAFLIGDNIVKLNADGPYRARYNESKEAAKRNHPEWTICPKCDGTGKNTRGKNCTNCKGTGRVAMHVHRHAMLLATKLLLKNFWVEWNK